MSSGMLASSEVPLPAWLEIASVPPSASTRSTRPLGGVGSPDAIVSNRQMQLGIVGFDGHFHHRGSGVFSRVGQRLGYDVIGPTSTESGNRRSTPRSRSTGTAERRASVLSAGPSPPLDRIAG